MPRPKKYDEPIQTNTLRLPISYWERIDSVAKNIGGDRPDAIELLLARDEELNNLIGKKFSLLKEENKQLREEIEIIKKDNENLINQLQELARENDELKSKIDGDLPVDVKEKLRELEKLKEKLDECKRNKEKIKRIQKELFFENQELRKQLGIKEKKPNFAYGNPDVSNLKATEVKP